MISLNPIIKPLVAIFIVIAVSGLIISISKENIENKAKQIREKRNMLAIMERHGENALELKRGYSIIKEKLPKIKHSLPDENSIGELVSSIENAATTTGNTGALSFDPLENSQPAGMRTKSLKFSAILNGNLETFSEYLAKLQKLPYFIEIGSITIKNDLGAANNNSQMALTAKVFISK